MKLTVVILFFLVPFVLMAQHTQTTKPGAAGERFGKLSEEFMYEFLALSPVSASGAGYHRHKDAKTGKVRDLDIELDDVSPASYQQQEQFLKAWAQRFRKETPQAQLGAQDAADWQLVDDQIQLYLLELQRIQSHRYNPTGYVELLGNALFRPLSQTYGTEEKRLSDVLARMEQIPRYLNQARQMLVDSDPIYIKVAVEENDGNIGLIEDLIAGKIPAGSPLRARFDKAAPSAVAAIRDFSKWLTDDLGKRKPTKTWRLGKELYAQKFRLVMQTAITPDQILADAESQMLAVRAEMLKLAEPMHKEMYADHGDHNDIKGRERENKIISEVLQRISDEHADRNQLIETVQSDLDGIIQFIRDKKIVSLSERNNLKVIPTPVFMRGIYSVGGFSSPPPLEPTAEAQYWVTPIDPKVSDARAESKLREYNKWVLTWLTIHEALPGHYIQFEHANSVEPQRRRLLRALFGNGPYVEGWAEYIAQVMLDEGFAGGSPRYRLMMRKLRLRVLSNTILDVRMETMNMPDQEAMDLMIQQAFQTQAEAEGKLQRAKLSSAQLPTYYVGLRDWLKLREEYQRIMGDKFDMQKFHDLVLDQGPLPIAYLRKIVLPNEPGKPTLTGGRRKGTKN